MWIFFIQVGFPPLLPAQRVFAWSREGHRRFRKSSAVHEQGGIQISGLHSPVVSSVTSERTKKWGIFPPFQRQKLLRAGSVKLEEEKCDLEPSGVQKVP